eukprot:gnl/MRDRNA2_/MRDRNA2_228966_c0_seq1.p1 gnl/MRDRNA2_/MRDRNA2_228966_c0~~gnl/MRDRNA2_/MRDRNA2_228966_c0_seq1.p1  ORF type:complete len:159 (+),score=39.41 gnl/MRDRNA2_/MRDRNA2_228966_c0_seq1:34-477(+)
MLAEIVRLMVLCTVTQGLLCISYVVADPFGDDILDFPLMAFTAEVACEVSLCESDNTVNVPIAPQLFTQEEMDWVQALKTFHRETGKFETEPPPPPPETAKGKVKTKKSKSTSEKICDTGDPDPLPAAIENVVSELRAFRGQSPSDR